MQTRNRPFLQHNPTEVLHHLAPYRHRAEHPQRGETLLAVDQVEAAHALIAIFIGGFFHQQRAAQEELRVASIESIGDVCQQCFDLLITPHIQALVDRHIETPRSVFPVGQLLQSAEAGINAHGDLHGRL